MGKRVLILVLILLLLLIPCTVQASFDDRVDIRGGITSSKSLSPWELHRYTETQLIKKHPLELTPWLAYIYVNQYTEVRCINNRNCLVINANLKKLVLKDARYNWHFCRRFKVKGAREQKIRKIYNYLLKTKYVLHKKTAREVFQYRQGDCAGVASAFYVMCKVKKIPVRYIIGWVDDGCHAWNMVKVNGKWWHIDCTAGCWLTKKPWDHYTVMEMW